MSDADAQRIHDDLYHELRMRELALRGLSALAIGLAALVFDVDVQNFLLLYALYVGFAMFVTAPLMFVADRAPDLDVPAWKDYVTAVVAMVVVWGLVVLWPLWAVWGSLRGQQQAAMTVWGVVAMAGTVAVLFGSALATARSYQRLPETERRAIDFKRAMAERAICFGVFIFLGPSIFDTVRWFGAIWSPFADSGIALVITYSLCEAYPFAMTLATRLLDANSVPKVTR